MEIKLFSKLGGIFFKNDQLRLQLIKKAGEKFESIKNQYRGQLNEKIDQHTEFFIKGYGNDLELISCFKELMFCSRELIDSLLTKMNKITEGRAISTSRNFLPFAKKLMTGYYDKLDLEIIKFFKSNITYIFHIRKIRNEMKRNLAKISFRFVTDHFEAYFKVPIQADETELIRYLDIKNKKEALEKMSYNVTVVLDEYFSEMIIFWKAAQNLVNSSI